MPVPTRSSPIYHLQQAIAADPLYADPHYHLALYFLEKDDANSAREHLESASAIAVKTAEESGAEALMLSDNHQFSRARLLLLKAREQQIMAAGSSYQLGLQYLEDDDRSSAEDSFNVAVICDLTHADAHFQLGRLRRGDGDVLEARRLFELCVTADYGHALAHIGLAEVITADDEQHLAVNHYLTALDLDVSLVDAAMEKRFDI